MIKGIRPALSEAGKIKIGTLGEERKGRNGTYRLPVKLDHFLVTKNYRGDDGLFVEDLDVMRALRTDSDGKVREIPIVLHSDDIDEVFPTSYALYAGKSLACRGDGEVATRWAFDKSTRPPTRLDDTQQMPCTCPLLEQGKCKPHGILHCSIAVPGVAVAGAVYKWRTTSIISVQRMIGSLQQILSVAGTLRGLPLALVVQPVKVTPQGRSQTVYTCHVELRAADLAAAQITALEAARARRELGGAVVDMKQLVAAPASEDESPEEQEFVAEEFYPVEDADIVGEVGPDEPKQSNTQAVKEAAKKQAKTNGKKKTTRKKPSPPPEPKSAPREEEPPLPGDDDIDYGEPEVDF